MLLYMSTLAIIVPCYNEQHRLDRGAVAELIGAIPDAVLYFVNDGSRDNTLEILNQLSAEYPSRAIVISYEKNEGKAKAIAKAVQQVMNQSPALYIGYMDADFSTPVREFVHLYHSLVREQAGFIFGSRIKKLNSGLTRKLSRHIIGRAISTFIDMRFQLGIYDTQCGAKIFSSETVRVVFADPFYANWLFDAEIFIRLKKNNKLQEGIEMPVTGWKDVHGSKLSVLSFPKICREFITLARKY